MTQTFAVTQRHRRAKQLLLAPLAPVMRGWALAGRGTALKAGALRRLVVPKVVADGDDLVLPIEPGLEFEASTRDLLGLYVSLFGVWEPNLTAFLADRLGPGDTFVDVGANVGWFSLQAGAHVGPTGRVVAIEASPILGRRLRANVARNGFEDRVRVVVAAAGDGVGMVQIVHGPAENTGLTRTALIEDGTVGVPLAPLGSLLSDEELSTARVVKVDVEGAEYAVVRGLADDLERFSDDAEFVVEVGPDRAAASGDVDELMGTFRRAGYNAFRLPNAYDVSHYRIEPVATALERIDRAPSSHSDVVFSRRSSVVLGAPRDHNARSDGIVRSSGVQQTSLRRLSAIAARTVRHPDWVAGNVRNATYRRREPADAATWTYRATPLEEVVAEVCGVGVDVAAAASTAEMPRSPTSSPLLGAPDGSAEYVRALTAICRLLRPSVVLETGVAHGVSSAAILAALDENGHGQLISIDLPHLSVGAQRAVGAAVTPRLRHRWALVLGPSEARLRRVLRHVAFVDVFAQDAAHTAVGQLAEYRLVWPKLRPGGVLVSDDVGIAFDRFAAETGTQPMYIDQHPKAEPIGVLRKGA